MLDERGKLVLSTLTQYGKRNINNIITEIGLKITASPDVTYITLSDAASTVDAITLDSVISLLETGQGLESISLVNNLTTNDTSTSTSDNLEMTASLDATDSSTSTSDSLTLDADLSTTDNSTSTTDNLEMIASLETADNSTATEDLGMNASLEATDIGSESLETIEQTGTSNISTVDLGLGIDQISLNVAMSLADTSTAIDVPQVTGNCTVICTGVASDAVVNLSVQLQTTDSATGNEVGTCIVNISAMDAASALDNLSNRILDLLIADIARGADTVSIVNTITTIDTFNIDELLRRITDKFYAYLSIQARDVQLTIDDRDLILANTERDVQPTIEERDITLTTTERIPTFRTDPDDE